MLILVLYKQNISVEIHSAEGDLFFVRLTWVLIFPKLFNN